MLAGGDGLTINRSEQASTGLLSDLRSDQNMDWMPRDMWLSYLTLDAPAGDLAYDLAVSTTPGVEPSLVDAGVEAEPLAARSVPEAGDGWPVRNLALGAGVVVIAGLGGFALLRRRPADGS